LLHAFALAHDDVMDGSPTRRGAPTVWRRFIVRHEERGWSGEARRFGEAAAVLVGDMAMVLAGRTLGPVNPKVRDIWDTLRTELNMGQYLDVVGTVSGGCSADQARTIIRHKTAGYTIVRPLQLGATLAGRYDLNDRLASHGLPLGTAFQLRDDILGAFGDPEVTGKPVGEDLREGKPTVLLAQARSAADKAQAPWPCSTTRRRRRG
jgi:geranylgeranyl diphosphate synthase type I